MTDDPPDTGDHDSERSPAPRSTDVPEVAPGVFVSGQVEYLQYPPSPIPSPNELARYDELEAGLARELVEMAKKEQAHRHERELYPYTLSKRGQTLGLISLVLLLIFCGGLVYTGNALAGAILAGLDVLGIVAVFVTGTISRGRGDSSDPEG